MTWAGIKGHDGVRQQFHRALDLGRLSSTFLFIGPAGIGKSLFAVKLAQALLCETHSEEDLEPCGYCPACQQVEARSHPDLVIVSKPKDRSFIPIELFIGDRDHRMREGLCHSIALKPYRGGRKIAIIEDADYLNQEGANCLLKTLEEPPPKSMLILIGTSEQKQLPTVRSRCQIIRFRPLPEATVADLLVSRGLIDDPDRAARLAALSGGSLQRVLELADEALDEFRQLLMSELSRADWDAVAFSRTLVQFVDEAGKDAPPRRARMSQLIGFAAEFYRQLMRSLSGLDIQGDDTLHKAVAAYRNSWWGDAETAAACLECCLDAEAHVFANANQATLLEWWLDRLATIARTGSPAS